MDIGNEVNKYVYNGLWNGVWGDCRLLMADKTRPEKLMGIFHSTAFNVDEVIRGGIVVEIDKTIMVVKMSK
jgi:hypothetical protein